MKIALLIVFALGVLLYVVFGLRHRLQQASEVKTDDVGNEKDCASSDSCGVSCFCADRALRRQLSEEIIYFEDEELDAFRGIPANEYDEGQIDAFSEVLTTLKPEEVADWLHSLELRGICLPEDLKEEAAIMMAG